jgi:hypothetical protein
LLHRDSWIQNSTDSLGFVFYYAQYTFFLGITADNHLKKIWLLIPFVVLFGISNAFGQITDTSNREILESLTADLQRFLQQFISQREAQIALLRTPLFVRTKDYHSDSTQRFTKKKLQESWNFLPNDFFSASTNANERYYSFWQTTNETNITYVIGMNETGFSAEYYFKKIRNKWLLTQVVYNNY